MALGALSAACSKEAKISIETHKVALGEISESVTATGTVESSTSVDVGTQVTGIISNLYVDYNSEVKQGQLIAEIEKTILQSELTSAEASVKSAQATYEYTKTNYERDKKLHERQLISDYEFDTSRRDYEVALTAYQKAKADKVKAAKNLNYAEIYSPIDGIVISRDVEVGQTVVSNMTVANLFTIADLDHMQVVANVDEADIGQVKVGQRVVFTVDAYPDDKFDGTVTQVRLSPTTESNVVTYEVIVSAANPDHKLIPGLTANLTIYVTEEKDVLIVPVKATRFTPHEYPEATNLPTFNADDAAPFNSDDTTQKRVWVIADGKLQSRIITTGANNGVSMVVLSGLNAGDIVALDYSVEAVAEEAEETTTEESPFAPKRPGKK